MQVRASERFYVAMIIRNTSPRYALILLVRWPEITVHHGRLLIFTVGARGDTQQEFREEADELILDAATLQSAL